MIKEQPKPVGYICVEKQTGAYDGIYTDQSDAEHMAGFLQALWKDSSWALKTAFQGDTVRDRFHTEESMHKKLRNLYGKENYQAADAYDRLSGAV